ncbi:MFS sugar transporter [Pyricularia grisea]|uniref:Major facilitator superfamily (MFS) profile domain-containing protein n=1 Tax=Pyricularia grisea TaxID=148305 RepID=A0A6P8BGT5_PYRGI|nr:uncharacterized protein PgNI_02243 [Pyricularia grisea]KAI6354484.1 MFS sugar transporter [Pyricularia grisea]TLD15925.1 hypothetical protein PgNI_02243 [Pyricularia grisea]
MSSVETNTGSRDLMAWLAESHSDGTSSLNHRPQLAETVDPMSDESQPDSDGRGLNFWATFAGLCIIALLSSMEGGIMSTALPSISRAVDAESSYVWIVNVYFLTSAAVQPLYRQVADIWGRRWPMLSSVIIFAAGSAICGAANDAATLIGGRAVQGLGVAGINTLVEIILCDLVPLVERGEFMGFLFLSTVIGSVLAPFLGGCIVVVDGESWRWVFYMNLPTCGLCYGLLFFSLKTTKCPRDENNLTTLQKLKKIDYDAGIILLCASVTSLVFPLAHGGAKYSWSHPVIITTLVLGLFGHGLFIAFEASPWCRSPVLPMALFQNRTSTAAYVLGIVQTLVSCGILYFLPLYFQSTLNVSTLTSAVLLVPFTTSLWISPAFGGGLITNSGKFRLVHFVSFALVAIAMGMFTLLNHNTPLTLTTILGIMAGVSVGLPNASILLVAQAALPNPLEAASTRAFALIRGIATVFAITIPAAIFNIRIEESLLVSGLDSSIKESLRFGKAYQQASSNIFNTLPTATQDHIVGLYELSLKLVWQALIGVAAIGVAASLIEKDLECYAEETPEEPGLDEGRGRLSVKTEV